MTSFNELVHCETAAEAKRIFEALLRQAERRSEMANPIPVEARFGDEYDEQFESYVEEMEEALRQNENNYEGTKDWPDFAAPPVFEALFLDKSGHCFCRVLGALELHEYPDLPEPL
jgi:hypothetical protein